MITFVNYLLIANGLGFVLYLLNLWIFKRSGKRPLDKLMFILSLLGASAGILLSMLIFDRRADKENMMSIVFIICVFVIQVLLILIFRGRPDDSFNFEFWKIFADNKPLLIYFGIINIISFTAFGIDKISALAKKNRIRIVTLLGLAFMGGAVGELIAMYLFNHKTKKTYFSRGLPLIILMQIVIALYFVNA